MAQIAHQSYLVSYFQRHTIHAWYGEREAPFPVRIKDDAAEVVTKWLMAETYPTRKLGPNGPSVSAIGLGAAGGDFPPGIADSLIWILSHFREVLWKSR